MKDIRFAFALVETSKEAGSDEKVITDIKLFSTREKAIAELLRRFEDVFAKIGKANVFSHDFNDDGWCYIYDRDDSQWDGYVSKSLRVN